MIAWEIIQDTLTITAFVTMMLLTIEYTNVMTGGAWMGKLTSHRLGQYATGAVLGAVPGCLGAFVMVSLYSHKRVSLGAIVTTMIATSGDEAFVMLAMFPKTAGLVFGGLMLLGILAGWITDTFLVRSTEVNDRECCDFEMHKDEWQRPAAFPLGKFVDQWRHPSAIRAILSVAITVFIMFLFAHHFGLLGPGEGGHVDLHGSSEGSGVDWEWVTLVTLLIFGLFIITTVSDHFLDDHLWNHVLKEHVPRIFLWTLGALAVIAVLSHFLDVEHLIRNNLWIVLGLAVAVGFIPESGPHLVFVTLFATGTIPLSILVASSAVQDGHGMVPMLAYSRKDFVVVKLINVGFGLLVGSIMLAAGW